MENTKQNALAFFGANLYAPAKCNASLFHPEANSKNQLGKLIMSPSIMADIWKGNFWVSDFSLLLKPLSAISDEDAIELLGLTTLNNFEVRRISKDERSICLSYRWISEKRNNADGYSYSEYGKSFQNLQFMDADFLRSRGYALPFNGLSVEQQLQYGWITLEETKPTYTVA